MNKHVYTNTGQRQVWRILPDLIKARELLLELVWKDLRVRYRYAVLGFLWAIAEPLALMLILTFVFTFAFKEKIPFGAAENSPPFAVTLLCGLIFWQFFATSITRATYSLIDSQSLVKKVCFTREVIPLASLGYPAFNLMIGVVLLLAMHVVMGGTIGLGLLWLPALFAIQLALCIGLGLLLSCLHVQFRDVGYMVGVAVVLGFYASPVFYPMESILGSDLLPAWAQKVYLLNPMAELLTAYRQIIFENRFPDLWLFAWPSASALISIVLGAVVFRYLAPTLSDHL